MRLDRSLDDLFRSASYVRVLRALFELPEGFATSARDIARRAGVSHPTASGALASFSEQGVVLKRRAARGDQFELNRDHIAVGEMEGVFEWERKVLGELVAFLGKRLKRKIPGVREAFLFGSVARSEMKADSDIDLALICTKTGASRAEDALEDLAGEVRARFGNRLNTIVATEPLRTIVRTAPGPRRRLWERIRDEGLPVIAERRSA
ncbi:MAG: nucleotidyltransferase domain-containing protein [Actinomycetota bacterium]